MRIIINEAEIKEAIELLITDQVSVPDDMRIDIDLKATRGEEGYQAFIDIVKHDAPEGDRSIDERVEPLKGAETLGIAEKVIAAKNEAAQPRRRGRPAGAKNKPKEVETTDAADVTKPAPVQEAAQATESIVKDEPVEETQVTENVTEAAPQADPEPVQEEAEIVVEEPQVAAAEAELEEPKELEEVIEPAAEPVKMDPPVEEAPKAPTKSLFANLSKPVNG